MELTGTHLRYLLSMYQLSHSSEEMRLTEIANRLNVKKASVARIVGVFRDKGLVDQRPYGKVHMTDYGKQVAGDYLAYVRSLADCLMQSGLHLTIQQAMDAACILLPELPQECIGSIKISEVVES
ncbi:MAG: helix-turn-helix domain-containing protein [Clostridia bacterium]|nr:helix-turn-helix domain-containing protein [Clostridia bacterium]